MLHYIIRRILIIIPVLVGMTVINFLIMHMSPGDPVEMFLDANTPLELIETKKEALGLNDPLYMQYGKWLLQLVQGNLGYSISSNEPVGNMILQRLSATFVLAAASLMAALLMALPIGIFSALKQNTKWDYLITGLSFVGTSIPNYFLGLALIYFFSLQLGLLPTGGMNELGGAGGLGDLIRHMVLPVSVLSIGIAGRLVRYVRASMLDVMKQDYMRTARSKGVHEFVVVNKHALRNALIPIITIVGMEVPLLLGGAIITEQIFQWPGIGQLTIQSILSRDYSVLMGLNLTAAIIVLSSNLLTDLAYSVVDPRIKYT